MGYPLFFLFSGEQKDEDQKDTKYHEDCSEYRGHNGCKILKRKIWNAKFEYIFHRKNQYKSDPDAFNQLDNFVFHSEGFKQVQN